MNRYLRSENPEQTKKNVRNLFNSIAGTYDFLNHFLSAGIDRIWRRKTIREMQIDSDSTILDLATGTGDLAREAARRKPRLIIGVDPSRGMLSRSPAKLEKAGVDFMAVEAFGEELPLPDALFSHAMIAYGIRNVSDRPQVFREFRRTLKPGGRLAILEFSRATNPLFRGLFNLYFRHILPFLGGLISRDREAYVYLPESVSGFVNAEQLLKEASEAGLASVKVKPMFFGITTLYLFNVV